MKKRLIIIICFVIAIINGIIYNVLAVEWGSIGTGSNDNYLKCGSTYNGCIGVSAYRYTIIKDVNIKSNGITYSIVPGTKSYEKPETLNAYYTAQSRADQIKTGGSLFKDIIENTNVNMQDFFSNNYYIMIEVKHIIYYSNGGSKGSYKNDKTLSGYTSEIAQQEAFLNGLNGLQSVTKQIPCQTYIPYSGSNDDWYCEQTANKSYKKNYFDIARRNSRFGKFLIYANDITKPKASLKVKKTNSSNDILTQLTSTTTAKFRLYNNSSCMGEVLKDFKAGETVSLTPGTYYLKEYQTKRGYHLPQFREKWYCEPVTLKIGELNEITVENKTECEYKFRSNMTMKERIDLYNLIKTNYSQEFNGLLDMNKTTASTACKNIPITKNYNKSCLQASNTSTNQQDFSNTNVSMYTEKYGSYTFCLTKYNLVNNLGKTNFTGIKSGQAIISTDNVVATATLNRVCYNFGDTNIIDDKYNNFNYSNYIEDDASIDGTKLVKSETTSGTDDNKTITVTYTLPVMYASNKDGRIYYDYCKEGEYCKKLGKGIISKFNLKPDTYDLKFDIKLKEEKLGQLNESSDCKYTIENELIDYKNNLALEFRTVKTNSNSSFLSKDGTSNRKIGANWSNEEDRKNVLINHNDSYNKNNEEPLYTITLTPSIIKEIRENNKNKSYDDYNMTCIEDGTICISNYLTCLQNRGILQIKERTNIDKFRQSEIVCKY